MVGSQGTVSQSLVALSACRTSQSKGTSEPDAELGPAPLCSQLGLFVEFSPEDMLLGIEETEGDEADSDLEAELLALTGEAETTDRKQAPTRQSECGLWVGWVLGPGWAPVSAGKGAGFPGTASPSGGRVAWPCTW